MRWRASWRASGAGSAAMLVHMRAWREGRRGGELMARRPFRRHPRPTLVRRTPHPLVLVLACIALAAVLSWVLPAGSYERRDDPATGRSVVVAGTYHRV